MKKIMLSLAMALVSVCASAQVYIGGTAGISSNKIGDGDSKTAYTLMPVQQQMGGWSRDWYQEGRSLQAFSCR